MNHRAGTALVFLSLGSNLGDRAGYLDAALDMLSDCLGEIRASRIYETVPLLYARQPGFLNCAACGNYTGSPANLLEKIRHIESELGRKRGRRYGPRTIDVDILLFGNRVVNNHGLVIPHPGIENRRFVLLPLLELGAGLRNPATGEILWKYLDKNHDQGVYFHSFSSYTGCIPKDSGNKGLWKRLNFT